MDFCLFGRCQRRLKEYIAVKLFLIILLLFSFFFLIILLLFSFSSISTGILLALRGLRITSLFAGPDSEPLGKFASRALGELGELLLPTSLEPFGSDDFSSTLVQLLSVTICSGVCSTLVLREHVDCGRMLPSE